jgi:hypothetical protein
LAFLRQLSEHHILRVFFALKERIQPMQIKE